MFIVVYFWSEWSLLEGARVIMLGECVGWSALCGLRMDRKCCKFRVGRNLVVGGFGFFGSG